MWCLAGDKALSDVIPANSSFLVSLCGLVKLLKTVS
jgi:hypothetical protein